VQVQNAEGKKAASHADNYQDTTTAPLNCNFDNDATTQDDSKADQARPDQLGSILLLVEKVLPYRPHYSHGLTFVVTWSFTKLSMLSD
jgi:hypothetical protein